MKLPITDKDGVKRDLSDYNMDPILKIADKRTHKYALECIRPHGKTTLKEALSAAYIQGMNDAISVN